MVCEIQPNPDISGTGIRVSIYVQASLTYIILFVAYADRRLSKNESRTLKEVYKNLLATSFALLAAITVQIRFGEPESSPFHILLVLNLGLVNTISILSFVFLDCTAKTTLAQEALELAFASHHPIILDHSDHVPWYRSKERYVILAFIHASAVSLLGLWTWVNMDSTRWSDDCLKDTYFSFAGQQLDLHSSKKLHIVSIVFYALLAIPVGNYLIYFLPLLFLAGFLVSAYNALYRKLFGLTLTNSSTVTAFLYVPYTCSLAFQVIFVVDIEIMIWRNKPIREDGWSFGQILALFLLISPIMVTAKLFYLQFFDRSRSVDKGVQAGASTADPTNEDMAEEAKVKGRVIGGGVDEYGIEGLRSV